MKVSLDGVLVRAAEACKRSSDSHLSFPLLELLKHLRELRQNPTLIGEFLELYVDEQYERERNPTHAN